MFRSNPTKYPVSHIQKVRMRVHIHDIYWIYGIETPQSFRMCENLDFSITLIRKCYICVIHIVSVPQSYIAIVWSMQCSSQSALEFRVLCVYLLITFYHFDIDKVIQIRNWCAMRPVHFACLPFLHYIRLVHNIRTTKYEWHSGICSTSSFPFSVAIDLCTRFQWESCCGSSQLYFRTIDVCSDSVVCCLTLLEYIIVCRVSVASHKNAMHMNGMAMEKVPSSLILWANCVRVCACVRMRV